MYIKLIICSPLVSPAVHHLHAALFEVRDFGQRESTGNVFTITLSFVNDHFLPAFINTHLQFNNTT